MKHLDWVLLFAAWYLFAGFSLAKMFAKPKYRLVVAAFWPVFAVMVFVVAAAKLREL